LKPVAVIGAGSWGTALAIHLARNGAPCVLWARGDRAVELQAQRENRPYLPGQPFPDTLRVSGDLGAALRAAPFVLFVVPVQVSRAIFRQAARFVPPGVDMIIASKGIEQDTRLRLSQVLAQELGPDAADRCTVLSGPSFAAEVVRGDPTAVVVAGQSSAATQRVQALLSVGNLRVYRNSDLIGVELGGALKNVMAIATGIVEGMGLGDNTRAALITRGLAEIARLGTALGGDAATFAGLAGAGDLILTCTGSLSRNRSVGMAVGRGRSLDEVLGEMRMVAEGVATTHAVVALAAERRVEMPIACKVHEILFEGRPVRDAVQDLLSRPLKEES
jgi:glycerol-3-phosphate dehydrogenase (NAD(P)+)